MAGELAFVGFGEAAQAFAGSLKRDALTGVRGFDLRADLASAMAELDVQAGADRQAVLDGAAAVWCLVTADQAEVAVGQCASVLPCGAFWFDGNSCSPGAKQRAATVIGAAGGRYVDVAIMAPVHPLRAAVPLLLAGPDAIEGAAYLRALGMQPAVVGDQVGQASTIKMLRSVMIKGLEALTAECVLAARKAGVEEAVLGSLTGSDPGIDCPDRSAYNLERMAVHGRRRAAEMREVAQTLADLGLPDRMARACVDWQQQISDLQVPMAEGEGVTERADRILAALARGR